MTQVLKTLFLILIGLMSVGCDTISDSTQPPVGSISVNSQKDDDGIKVPSKKSRSDRTR